MSQKPIPAAWRAAVIAALRAQNYGFKQDSYREWQNDFPGAYKFELEQAFIQFLSIPNVTGCHVTMRTPPGETWEFYFPYESSQAYGKILLRTDGVRIVIFSAHRPQKPKLSCE